MIVYKEVLTAFNSSNFAWKVDFYNFFIFFYFYELLEKKCAKSSNFIDKVELYHANLADTTDRAEAYR